jgi:hypothetical protein
VDLDPEKQTRKARYEINALESWMFSLVGWRGLLFELRITS